VENFEEALAVANNTEYGLTGAIYSGDRAKLDIARREFHVGNLYLNRKCTGAMVGAHPFGGFNMSGTDSKAGGPDYLFLFTQAKSVAEKLTAKPTPTGIKGSCVRAPRLRRMKM
jgi:1-pyrroline-5-carboxylate dehydrogenase